MRITLSVLVGLLALSGMANAADTTEFKWNGEIRTRFDADSNSNLNNVKDNSNYWQTRALLGVKMSQGDNSAFIQFANNGQWGASAGSNFQPGGVGSNLSGAPGATTVSNDLPIVQQAYGQGKVGDNWIMKMGRVGASKLADGTVISTGNWGRIPKAYDGLQMMGEYDFGRIWLAGVKVQENQAPGTVTESSAQTTNDKETNIYGAAIDLKGLPDMLKMGHFHLLQVNSDTSATAASNYMRYGVVLGGGMSGLDFNLSYAALSGKSKTNTGVGEVDLASSMINANLGYTLDFKKTRIGIQYHTDTGEDADATKTTKYDAFQYDSHRNSGLADILGWGNLNYIEVNLGMEIMDDTKLLALYTMFNRTVDTDTVSWGTGISPTYVASKTALGTEMDLMVEKKMSANTTMHVMYSMFTPGEAIKPGTGSDPEAYSKFQLQATMTY